jgi:hypothetical protein
MQPVIQQRITNSTFAVCDNNDNFDSTFLPQMYRASGVTSSVYNIRKSEAFNPAAHLFCETVVNT